jgi:hypothetical protein
VAREDFRDGGVNSLISQWCVVRAEVGAISQNKRFFTLWARDLLGRTITILAGPSSQPFPPARYKPFTGFWPVTTVELSLARPRGGAAARRGRLGQYFVSDY